MKQALENWQYRQLIQNEVVNPYLNMIDKYRDVQGSPVPLTYTRETDKFRISYYHLYNLAGAYPEWWKSVIERLSMIYSMIDFSFFPEEKFAVFLRTALIKAGVKPIEQFERIEDEEERDWFNQNRRDRLVI